MNLSIIYAFTKNKEAFQLGEASTERGRQFP
jgi:hypothetical protein